jgi:ectoine hydroxylase-related dioxygenase (phytanoyl-CoA dioxygenase family)
MITEKHFLREINDHGMCVVEGVLDAAIIARMKMGLIAAMKAEANFHKTENHPDSGMVLLCVRYRGVFLEILGHPGLIEPFHWLMGDGCIVYANTSTSMPPRGANYSARIHVDSPWRTQNYITSFSALILLDDFTELNGATWYLPGSHNIEKPPAEDYFYANAKRLIAPAGSVLFWHPRIWHAGGVNKTDSWRHAMTVVMCRSFMKQRIDIPRILADMDLTLVPEQVVQKLGFRAQVPASYEEYYAPIESRKFSQKVD